MLTVGLLLSGIVFVSCHYSEAPPGGDPGCVDIIAKTYTVRVFKYDFGDNRDSVWYMWLGKPLVLEDWWTPWIPPSTSIIERESFFTGLKI